MTARARIGVRFAAALALAAVPSALIAACGDVESPGSPPNIGGGGGTHHGSKPDAGAQPDAETPDTGSEDDASDAASDASDAMSDAPDDSADLDAPDYDAFDAFDATACATDVEGYALAPGIHVPICSYISWPTNPPTSGEHYPIWAAYRSYDKPVPRGFYLHDMEHGGIVVLYNCPDGCAADVANVEAFLSTYSPDPECIAPVTRRFTVTPDPLIPTRFAAAAWGFSLTSNCFDLGALSDFIATHYGHGPEDFCTDGIDPTSPDAGFPPDCGDAPDGG